MPKKSSSPDKSKTKSNGKGGKSPPRAKEKSFENSSMDLGKMTEVTEIEIADIHVRPSGKKAGSPGL